MEDITVEELKIKLDRKDDFVFIDVREQMEYDTFNLDAQLIPLGSLMNHLEDLEEFKEKEIVVHCRSGMRSATAKKILITAGFQNVRNLIGGVLAWISMQSN